MNSGDIIGNYRIVRLLGAGGMGAVYEAMHETIERRVALKVLHDTLAHDRDAMNRFFNEARATNRIDHPSIVQISDFGHVASGAGYLVMEYLRGGSLAKRLEELRARKERMDVTAALQIAWQVADALTVAHSAGIVHRDLKPENLMLVEDPIAPSGERVKILDFGIAKLTKETANSAAQTAAHALMGTPLYMSPEQCAGAGGVDDKTDVYALGVMLYEMLAGHPPFEGLGMGPLLLAHMTQQPRPLQSLVPGLSTDVAKFVHLLLWKQKTERPSMQQTQILLSDLLMNISGSVPAIRRRPSGTLGLSDLALSRRSARSTGATNTLGQSLGQTLRLVSSRPGRFLAIAACGLVTATLASLLFHTRHRSHADGPATPAAVLPRPAVEAAPAKESPAPISVRWAVASEPLGADVIDEKGQRVGQTPWVLKVARGPGETRLRLRKKGYEEASVVLPQNQDGERTVTLHASAPSGPAKKKKRKAKGLEIED